MRSARVQDYWNTVYKRKYKNWILKINLKGLNKIYEINLSKGAIAFCGLNGAGKSTIISAIKDIVGLNLTSQDSQRIAGHEVEGIIYIDNNQFVCKNTENERLFSQGIDSSTVKYIDCVVTNDVQDYMISQTNLDEFLEQYEECELSDEELKDINYLIGKSYSNCVFYEVDDLDENYGAYPFFKVQVGDIQYDTRSMGNGEHFLLCLFWFMKRLNNDAILIIEEPETYISIISQRHLADYIGKIISKKGIKVILTTHSPFILKHIKEEHIRIVSRIMNEVSIVAPDRDFTVKRVLGFSQSYLGTLFVEDQVASDFLTVILEDKAPWILKKYAIDIVGGESKISERLKFPKDPHVYYRFIGVYDGDMRERINFESLNWNYCFLPGNKPVEEYFREYICQSDNLDKLCTKLKKDKSKIIVLLSTLEGLDHHDWFLDFFKELCIERRHLVKDLYSMMMSNDSSIDLFISELQNAID